jgi:hypothetical protein
VAISAAPSGRGAPATFARRSKSRSAVSASVSSRTPSYDVVAFVFVFVEDASKSVFEDALCFFFAAPFRVSEAVAFESRLFVRKQIAQRPVVRGLVERGAGRAERQVVPQQARVVVAELLPRHVGHGVVQLAQPLLDADGGRARQKR